MGDYAEALRWARIERNEGGSASGEPGSATASASAKRPNWISSPIVPEKEERVSDASLTLKPWEALAEGLREKEAKPLAIPAFHLTRRMGILAPSSLRRGAYLAITLALGVGAFWWELDWPSRTDRSPTTVTVTDASAAHFAGEARASAELPADFEDDPPPVVLPPPVREPVFRAEVAKSAARRPRRPPVFIDLGQQGYEQGVQLLERR